MRPIWQVRRMADNYTVRVSPRAKHARLSVSLREGLVVVVPRGFNKARIPALLDEKRPWIEKALARVEAQRRLVLDPETPERLPEHLALRCVDEDWAVHYRPTGSSRVAALEQEGDCLLVSGNVDDAEASKRALRRWLARKAERHLTPWLERLAGGTGRNATRLTIRLQRTRWGSCSRQGAVNLNLKLLFLPPDLVEYVLVHELCHRVHLNHSKRFWALVAKHAPTFREKEAGLKEAFKYIPGWLQA